MSHACILVALDGVDKNDREAVEDAISEQMAPFDENGEFFADGSRWDWWTIGGRFTGSLDPDYDPIADPRNIKVCEICSGTGFRDDAIAREARQRDPAWCGGCNGCHGAGKRTSFQLADFDGDIKLRSELDHLEGKLSAFAFLRSRLWHERRRMGWWGTPATTECQIKAEQETGETYTGRCIHECATTGSKIVSWSDDDRWESLFWPRFIRNLPPESVIAVVDYHV